MLNPTKIRSILLFTGASALIAYGLAEIIQLPLFYMWFVAINIITFVGMGKDKLFAVMNFSRTPEATFHVLAALGAWPGLFLARKIFNHKTSDEKFITVMWIIFIAELIAAAYFAGDLAEYMPKVSSKSSTYTTNK